MVTRPIDGMPATAANGATIGIVAARQDPALAWHNAGVALGEPRSKTRRPSAQTSQSSLISAILTETSLRCGRTLQTEQCP